jgi:uncharacterized membrane protein required for colicin V production
MDGSTTPELAGSGLMNVDLVGLGLVAVFALLGAWRGLWWQLLRLVGLAAAVLTARSLEPSVSGLVEGRLSDLDPRVLHGVVWLVLFLATGALFAMLGKLGKRMLEAMQLGLLDRVGGAVAGITTGLVLHAALLAALVQIASDAFLAQHLHHSYSEKLVQLAGVEQPFLFRAERGHAVHQRLVPAGTTHVPPGQTPPTVR